MKTILLLLFTLLFADQYGDHIARGEAAAKENQFAEAIEASKAAIKLDPARYEAYLLWGTALASQKKCDEAIPQFKKAALLAEDDARPKVNAMISACLDEIAKPAVKPVPAPAPVERPEPKAIPLPTAEPLHPEPKPEPKAPPPPPAPQYIVQGDSQSCELSIDGERAAVVPGDGAYTVKGLTLGEHLFVCKTQGGRFPLYWQSTMEITSQPSRVARISLGVRPKDVIQTAYNAGWQLRTHVGATLKDPADCGISSDDGSQRRRGREFLDSQRPSGGPATIGPPQMRGGTMLSLASGDAVSCDGITYMKVAVRGGFRLTSYDAVDFYDGKTRVEIP